MSTDSCADPVLAAAMVSTLAGQGHRVLVTGADPDALARVRAAFGPEVRALCRSGPDPLTDAERRELHGLLAGDPGPAGPAPRWADTPDAGLVAELCTAAARPAEPPRTTAELIPELLVELPADRRAELTGSAAHCLRALDALDADDGAGLSWLVGRLVFGGDRDAFDRLRRGRPAVTIALGSDCAALDLPTPTDAVRLARRLEPVADAVAAVDALRHRVLFIHPGSPIAVPDLPTVREVARQIVAAPVTEEMVTARRRLAELADGFAARAHTEPGPGPAHRAAVWALREGRLPDYLTALRDLDAADRARTRREELLDRLAAAEPSAACALRAAAGRGGAVPGAVWLSPIADLPAGPARPDGPDVVVLLAGNNGSRAAALDVARTAGRRLVVVGADAAEDPPAPADRPWSPWGLPRPALAYLAAVSLLLAGLIGWMTARLGVGPEWLVVSVAGLVGIVAIAHWPAAGPHDLRWSAYRKRLSNLKLSNLRLSNLRLRHPIERYTRHRSGSSRANAGLELGSK